MAGGGCAALVRARALDKRAPDVTGWLLCGAGGRKGRGTRVPQGDYQVVRAGNWGTVGAVQSVGRGRGAVPEDQHVGRQLGGRMSSSLRAAPCADPPLDRVLVHTGAQAVLPGTMDEQGFCSATGRLSQRPLRHRSHCKG